MPGLVQKLFIFASVDGLVLEPANNRAPRTPSLQVRYTRQGAASLQHAAHSDAAAFTCLEAYGIVGLLDIASATYLISISRRQQVAQVRGVPIYTITGVALIPLSSQSDAEKGIKSEKEALRKETSGQDLGVSEESDDSDDGGSRGSEDHTAIAESPERARALSPPYGAVSRKTREGTEGVAQDVISRKGQYGVFAEKWFSRKGWKTERRRAQGMSADELTPNLPKLSAESDTRKSGGPSDTQNNGRPDDKSEQGQPSADDPRQHDPPNASEENTITNTLLPKLIQTSKILLGSRSFYFSYDTDITRRHGSTTEIRDADVPLHRSVDPMFFWNRHLALPLIENGDHAYVLPLMQGFVGQRAFAINPLSSTISPQVNSKAAEIVKDVVQAQQEAEPGSNFLLTLISRRSVKRPGLRYLRRGVDDDGHTANSVETEQILSRAPWSPEGNIYSVTQIRGSIPLFFSQSPYAFKPIPLLQHSFETNQAAFKRHFANLARRYGDVQVALLVDKHGGEAKIGQKYREHTEQFNADGGVNGTQIGFKWFDFHAECRGMKFENVSLLIESLDKKLDEFGTTVEVGGNIREKQAGVLRTSCMDCLDRTNVVQSACASRALEKQLLEENIKVDLQTDTTTQWFNTLWADNGDAISKQYSSTAALKGDFTRTRKRGYRGALNDLGLTVSRYYNNIVNDYFSQAAIDYLLGNVTEQVFEEFEADMMSRDPAISMRKVRANAIETSSKIVIADQSEEMIGAWTLLGPHEPNTVRTFPFEEVILLLTETALYAVRFDWTSEKVLSFERVSLSSVTGIMQGTYITSTLAPAQTNEAKNVGLIVKYRPSKEDIARVNTRSMISTVSAEPKADVDAGSSTPSTALIDLLAQSSPKAPDRPTKFLAFKALPARSSLANADGGEGPVVSERELVTSICDEMRRAAYGGHESGSDEGFSKDFVEERDIISLKEARESTGYLEQWGHSLKKLVWA